MTGKTGHRGFGHLRKLPSKRWQASYIGPDGLRHTAPSTFGAKLDAEGWLAAEARLVESDTWRPPDQRHRHHAVTFGEYAAAWLADRTLKPRSRSLYQGLLNRLILPTFATTELRVISPHQIRAWHTSLGADTPTQRAHAYALLRTILSEAVHDGELSANPARIRGAGNAKRVHKIKPASLTELEVLVAAMPGRYRLMVLLAAWCGLRYGELAELRRGDLNLQTGVVSVRRAVVRVDRNYVVGTPKSEAGVRDVNMPPHLLPMVKAHLANNISGGKDGLLFPASDGTTHLNHRTLSKIFHRAREAAGRPDLRFHDLRHTGAVLAASTGATLAELMSRLGHSTPAAAMRYQHAAADRDKVIAEALSALATTSRGLNNTS